MGQSSCKLHCESHYNNRTLMHAGCATAGTLSSVLTPPRCVQEFFETHESDAYVLKHDKQLAKDPQQQRHLRHLPEYIKKSAGVQAGSRKKGNAVRGIKRKLRPDDDPLRVRNWLHLTWGTGMTVGWVCGACNMRVVCSTGFGRSVDAAACGA